MSTTAYTGLVKQFCSLVGISDVDRVIEQGAVEIEDVLFSLFHFPSEAGDLLLMYCDCGPVPHGLEDDIYLQLLHMNMHFSTDVHSLGFSLNPENANVVFSYRLELEQMEATKLLHVMNVCVRQVQDWRRSNFLGSDAGSVLAALTEQPT